TSGGMTIYYTPHDFSTDDLKNQPIKAFQPVGPLCPHGYQCSNDLQGFRMTVGSPTTSTLADANKHIGLRYNCLQTLLNRGAEMTDFPTKPCPAGIFTVHHFP